MVSIPKLLELWIFFCPCSKFCIPVCFCLSKCSLFLFKIFVSIRYYIEILINRKSKLFLSSLNSFNTKWSTVNISSSLLWSTLTDYRLEPQILRKETLVLLPYCLIR